MVMANEHAFDEKGKVQPKPEHDGEIPQKVEGPITVSELEGRLNADKLTRMQQTVGNAAVQRFLAQRSAEGQSEIDDETAATINAKRGQGHSLEEGISSKAGQAMDHDFSGVNVHNDSQSDDLNAKLGAKAFTTGSDIFFKQGAYDPSSSDGQELISHELTHVVQQSGNTTPGEGKLTVNDPNDQYESQADAVANSVLNLPEEEAVQNKTDETLQRQPIEEEEEMMQPKLQRQEEEEQVALQPIEEEEEMMQPKLQMQEEEEMMPKLQRQEEEEMMPKLQRQEEEEMMPKLQRQEEEEMMPKLQRQEEEEMMPKLQRQEEEEMMPKLQRQEEEEMMPKLQRQEEEEMMPKLQRQDELPEEAV
jgi:hypothetical protein